MEMDWPVLGTWLVLVLFSVLSLWGSYKLWKVPTNDQRRITKAIIYSFLSVFVLYLITVIMEIFFPLPKSCVVSQRDWLIECNGKHINWHFIQAIAIGVYFMLVYCIWSIWELLYGKLHRLPIQMTRKFYSIVSSVIMLLGILMMLPLAWLRNFLLDIFMK